MQPLASRVIVTDRPLPSDVLLLDAEDRPSLEEDTETELLEDRLPADCALARALPSRSSDTIVVSTRPSAK
ncbi:hypothetical protein [Sphingomonas mucosissima]|uniref:hypothetical protein n=1 Tax=Sphingomonas mucosissima TaxID=370959 RepID=UPI0011250686|nr:hypothetical protein [Sphingomonas mucosissima]